MNDFQAIEHEVMALQHEKEAAYSLSKSGERLPALKIDRLPPGSAGNNLNRRWQ